MDSLPPNVAESFDSQMIESLTRDTSVVVFQAGIIISDDSLNSLNFLFENDDSIPVDTSNYHRNQEEEMNDDHEEFVLGADMSGSGFDKDVILSLVFTKLVAKLQTSKSGVKWKSIDKESLKKKFACAQTN